MPPYRIVNWNDHFENSRSRAIGNLRWVAMPNKHDGEGYSALVNHPDGAAHYGGWCAIVGVASKCNPRGTLVRGNGSPLTPDALALKTRLPSAIFAELLPRLASPQIAWLEDLGAKRQEGDGRASGGCHASAVEGKGREIKNGASAPGPFAVLAGCLRAEGLEKHIARLGKMLKDKCGDPQKVLAAALEARERLGGGAPGLTGYVWKVLDGDGPADEWLYMAKDKIAEFYAQQGGGA